MMWLTVSVIAYVLLAFVFLFDKYLITKVEIRPRVLAFTIGFFGILVFFLIPFVGFSFPPLFQFWLAIAAGAMFTIGIFWNFKGLQKYEASRIVPAIGGLVPLFSFILIFLISGGKETLAAKELAAFLLLLAGTVFITLEPGKSSILKSMRIAVVAAFFFALFFVLSKYAYEGQGFWSPFILMRVGGFAAALFFLKSREVQDAFFGREKVWQQKKTVGLFAASSAMAVVASVLLSVAVFLAPIAAIPLINALQGVQYVFLLLLVTLLSLFAPRIIKETVSKRILWQKTISVFLIIIGLALLAA